MKASFIRDDLVVQRKTDVEYIIDVETFNRALKAAKNSKCSFNIDYKNASISISRSEECSNDEWSSIITSFSYTTFGDPLCITIECMKNADKANEMGKDYVGRLLAKLTMKA
jgi:hypothetical protein